MSSDLMRGSEGSGAPMRAVSVSAGVACAWGIVPVMASKMISDNEYTSVRPSVGWRWACSGLA